MKYNKKILYTVAVLCLTLGLADASSLVNLDLKKSSDNTVDMTFFTTGASTTPMVTNKGNNKYVILMPNVSGLNANTPSLGGVKDLITDINVKNVDDGMNGYTKVTLTTTKPINIKTYSKKAAPLSAEEKQAKAIIAQVKTKPVQTQQNKYLDALNLLYKARDKFPENKMIESSLFSGSLNSGIEFCPKE